MGQSIYASTILLIDDSPTAGVFEKFELDQVCSFFMAKVCCSIEMEPRTLSQVQLNHAREMAEDVVQKMESNEASATFSEVDHVNIAEAGEEPQNKLILESEEAQLYERSCQCLCAAANIETPDQEKLKEPLSAPF
ncbi:uncharacterized protein LOC112190287 isoform X2 [Rosa chinensis]|uniref:uncharacterized protein LOC112190287 isoform X2 n=1 Tax=Rosa chinensis TaxID=74649 RepID=UPI000D092E03|nr:uncharacterized protein LOC112190287 isoform X2 [Rosa chinensis]